MQKATRSIFTQKGSEVQKINQSGIWAYVESSYPNPDFDSACNGYELGEGEGKIISVAKWIYRCKRLLRKSNHVAVSVDNGEVLEPCYLIEPSSEDRLQDKTLVWLEPLPQLNGYVIIPGGTSQCGEGYGSGSGLGPGSSLGSNPSLGDCDSLLNCLCVAKDSEGRVTGLFVKKPNGNLVEMGECYYPFDCIASGVYTADYHFQINGEEFSGTSNLSYHSGNQVIFPIATQSFRSENNPFGIVYVRIYFPRYWRDIWGRPFANIVVSDYYDWVRYCVLREDDLDVVISGCEGLTPIYYITTLPGRCISGTFILRPIGTRVGGDRRGYAPCCPGEYPLDISVVEYDLTLYRPGRPPVQQSGTSGGFGWVGNSFSARVLSRAVGGICSEGYFFFYAKCGVEGRIYASLYYYCWYDRVCGLHLQPGYDDLEFFAEGCPDRPIFHFVVKPGRCMSGWFKIRPYRV